MNDPAATQPGVTNTPEAAPAPPLAARPSARRTAVLALAVFLGAAAVYSASAIIAGQTSSPQHAYFNHLAAAFLDGRLHLADPPGLSDLTEYDGRWYVPFPPLPALIMLPWVALAGLARTNTMVFSILFAAGTCALVYLLLDRLAARRWITLEPAGHVLLAAMLAVGSVLWWVTVAGSVWHLAHVFTTFFVALAALLAAGSRSPWLAAAALALAVTGRPNILLAWPLLAGLAAQRMRDERGRVDRRAFTRWCWQSAIPLAISLAALAAYNYARFDNPLDFGYTRQNVNAEVMGDLHEKGQFHYSFIPRNLYWMLLALPDWPRGITWPQADPHGLSIFLTTPPLLLLWLARGRSDPLARGAWTALGLLLIPVITYYNTGWMQFGYRFSLDFMVPAVVLIAAGLRRVDLPVVTLVLLGVAVNTWGVLVWFTRWLSY